MTEPTMFRRLALCFVLVFVSTVSWADSAWVRIDQPDPATRAQLPPEAIDYGRFIWLPASAAEGLRSEARQHLVDNPFHMTAGERRFDPATEFPVGADPWFTPGQGSEHDFRLVQFEGPIKPEWLDQLRISGVEPIQYLHPFSYIVWASPQDLDAARNVSRVRFVGDMLPVFRVPIQSREPAEQHPHTMAMVHRQSASQIIERIQATGAAIVRATPMDRHFTVLQIEAMPDRFLDLARIPGVYTVQQISQTAGLRGEMSNQSIVGGYDQNNVISPGYLSWLNPTGLDGSGVVVGIVDSGILATHLDLQDNIAPCVPSGSSPTTCQGGAGSHGTHVAGAVAGSGTSGITDSLGFLRGQGVAPGASLISQRTSGFLSGGGPGGMIPDGMLMIFKESALSGAVLTNNSWGPTGSPQGYDIPTRQIDIISRDANPDTAFAEPVLAVWSVMNGNGDSFGACAPSSLGSPDEAKNLFAVGSTFLQTGGGAQINDIFSVSANSGHGPACDGRLVPHIVAPGCNTDSTDSFSDTAFGLSCGTSMASPVVSGAVALFVEAYRNTHGVDPSPALVKTVFTAAARDLVGNTDADDNPLDHRPDRKQGWGRIDLDAVINAPVNIEMVDQTEVFTATGQDWTTSYTPEDPDQPMRIMLAWTDAPGPGTGGTTPSWTNDLDLVVEVGGQTYYGNNIDPSTGWSVPGGSPDGINNLEGIMLSPAQHQGQAITLTVVASNVAEDALDPWNPGSPRQDFALTCYNCLNEPDFSIALDPTEIEVCLPDQVSSQVTIGSVLGFSDLVNLSVASSPAGVNADLDDSSVTPPGSTTLNVDVTAGASPGSETVVLEGTSTTGTQSRTLSLELFDQPPASPMLLSPADGATGQSFTLDFSWQAASQAGQYRFQLATDPVFFNVVADITTSDTEVTGIGPLASSTRHYWRVLVDNACGDNASPVFDFTTQPAAGDCPASATTQTVYADDMETGAPGWAQGPGGVQNTWELSDERSFSGDFSWHAENLSTTSDQRLVSPAIQLPGSDQAPITLRFQNYQIIEAASGGNCWDAGILEISTNDGGTWTQVVGNRLLTQPYSGTVNQSSNPLAGLSGWCGDPVPWTDNVVDLSDWAGEEIRLRFRLGTDNLVGREGWYIDDVRVEACEAIDDDPLDGIDLVLDIQAISGPLDRGNGQYEMSFLVEARNAGQANAPDAELSVSLSPAPDSSDWSCAGFEGATCPFADGSGDFIHAIDLPAGSALIYLIDVVQDESEIFQDLNASLSASPIPGADNNPSASTKFSLPFTGEGIFRDAFE